MLGILSSRVFCQESFLDQEPYFVSHKAKPTDSLFWEDVRILKSFVSFDSLDMELLRPLVLGSIMIDEVNMGKPATYRTMVEYFRSFMKTMSYQDFHKGMMFYRKTAHKKIDIASWETDMQWFISMGFTESDLEDLKEFMLIPENKGKTYFELYEAYMKEVEAS